MTQGITKIATIVITVIVAGAICLWWVDTKETGKKTAGILHLQGIEANGRFMIAVGDQCVRPLAFQAGLGREEARCLKAEGTYMVGGNSPVIDEGRFEGLKIARSKIDWESNDALSADRVLSTQRDPRLGLDPLSRAAVSCWVNYYTEKAKLEECNKTKRTIRVNDMGKAYLKDAVCNFHIACVIHSSMCTVPETVSCQPEEPDCPKNVAPYFQKLKAAYASLENKTEVCGRAVLANADNEDIKERIKEGIAQAEIKRKIADVSVVFVDSV